MEAARPSLVRVAFDQAEGALSVERTDGGDQAKQPKEKRAADRVYPARQSTDRGPMVFRLGSRASSCCGVEHRNNGLLVVADAGTDQPLLRRHRGPRHAPASRRRAESEPED